MFVLIVSQAEFSPSEGVVTLWKIGRGFGGICSYNHAPTTSRHLCRADVLKAWCVLAEVRWRWTWKVFSHESLGGLALAMGIEPLASVARDFPHPCIECHCALLGVTSKYERVV